MSRIGKAPISLPSNVDVAISKGNLVTVKGPKGSLSYQVDMDIKVEVEDGTLSVTRPTDQKRHRSLHGTYRAVLNNLVRGVSDGFVKEMELIEVGYRASNTGNILELTLGYAHPIMFVVPKEITLSTSAEKGQAPGIKLESNDLELLGQICAKIRSFRKPEPYKGKGIKFKGEIIRRKAGKTSGKK